MTREPSPSNETPPDLTGRQLDDFKILRKLGQGGMGQVYLARQESLKRDVAIKILRSEWAANSTALSRFQSEAEIVARISHPNIVQVYAVGNHEGLRYMALEYVEGRNLRDYLDRKGPPEIPVTISIILQIAKALQRAAELGLVHRDIKPENVLINPRMEVKVTDFGLSRYFSQDAPSLNLTQSGMTLGTPLYMSPEQVQGKAIDHRSDLYSLGVTAYHLLAGFPPFRGETTFDVALQHVQSSAPPLEQLRSDIPPLLIGIVNKLMAKKPEDRYQSALELIRDLSRIAPGELFTTDASLARSNPEIPSPASSSSLVMNSTLPTPTPGSVNLASWQPETTNRRSARILGVVAALAALALGWWLSGYLQEQHSVQPIEVVSGLPPWEQKIPLVSTYEKTLREKLATPLASEEYLKYSLELVLLLIEEKRFEAIEQILEQIKNQRGKPSTTFLQDPLIKKLVTGIILAQQDQAKASQETFVQAVALIPKNATSRSLLTDFFFRNLHFSHAISEAIYRNEENGAKAPVTLEWLRTPSGILRGPK